MNRKMAMVIFLIVVLIVYSSVNYYIYRHTQPVFNSGSYLSLVLKFSLILLIISFPLGRTLEWLIPSALSGFVVKIGSYWLGAMLYLTLIFLTFDFIRLVFWIFGHSNLLSFSGNPILYGRISAIIYGLTFLLLLGGYINALFPRVNQQVVKVNKSASGLKTLRIGAASDIHLGTVIANGRLERFVNLMNSQKPDIILLAGDIFDEDLKSVIKRDMGKLLSRLNAPYGVYAVTGNHEYIGGVESAVSYLVNHGIKVLRDSTATVEGLFNVVGREDRQSKVMAGFSRKSLKEIVEKVDMKLPTILLDHQPYNLHEAEQNGIDVQISGHTHHGQMWPFNFITKSIFEVSRGYMLKGNTHIFVSTGYGTWGPPVRIGNRPEILVIDLIFE